MSALFFSGTRGNDQPRCLQLPGWSRSKVAQVRPTLSFSFQLESSRLVPDDDKEVKFDGPGLTTHTVHHTNAGWTASVQLRRTADQVSESGEEMEGGGR